MQCYGQIQIPGYVIPKHKLNTAYFSARAVKPYISQESLRVIYFSYFCSIMSYDIIFWGNSSVSNNIFRLQKRVIRIITNIRSKDSCREQCKKLQILPLQSQYVHSSLLFEINSSDIFEHNCEIHTISTSNRSNLNLSRLRLQQFKMVPTVVASRFTVIFPPMYKA